MLRPCVFLHTRSIYFIHNSQFNSLPPTTRACAHAQTQTELLISSKESMTFSVKIPSVLETFIIVAALSQVYTEMYEGEVCPDKLPNTLQSAYWWLSHLDITSWNGFSHSIGWKTIICSVHYRCFIDFWHFRHLFCIKNIIHIHEHCIKRIYITYVIFMWLSMMKVTDSLLYMLCEYTNN